MSKVFNIKFGKYQNIKTVKVDDRELTARPFGASEGLELQSSNRKQSEIFNELTTKINVQLNDPSIDDAQKLKTSKRAEKLLNDLEELRAREIELYSGLFDDGENGKFIKKYLATLSSSGLRELIEDIFKD